MSKFLKKCIILIGGGLVLTIGLIVFLFFDAFDGGYKFRTMQDEISSIEDVDLKGLRALQASGGNAPRFNDLQKRLSHVKQNKTIVDVKCESHGYINGIPTTFLGYGLPKPGFRHLLRRLLLMGTIYERLDLVTSEQEEAKKYEFDYKTVNIGSNFTVVDEKIDEIVHFFDTFPENEWLHVHCHHGKGRTSMILVMLDIMRNAPKVTLEDIVRRQYLLGSTNLFDTEKWVNGTYTQAQLEARKKFIEDFYEFVCQRKAGGFQLWSDWHRQQR